MQKQPVQPPEKTWHFMRELQAPLHEPVCWRRKAPLPNEARLDRGCCLRHGFPDPLKRLQTAYTDFRFFLQQVHVPRSDLYVITTGHTKTALPETYRIDVNRRECRILSGDTEGIRRGLIWVEDRMLANGGPFLALGRTERRPVIRTRISRCFFGPIHRPPKNRDELADNVNYYPDEYLNRLAHDGVNGLWLTVYFSEICRQSVIKQYGRKADRRLDKLRKTVERCARYGIKIYLFANEPAPLKSDGAVIKSHPELAGNRRGANSCYFCTSNATAQLYLKEAMRNLFAAVPGLGGLINISIGEGGSHCWSGSLLNNTCPRCAKRPPYKVLNDTLAAMEHGMHASNPEAELISWPYTQYSYWGDELTVDSAGRLPQNVILQQNFESSAEARQCGHRHKLFDYWLSYIGPSKNFTDCARAAVKNGNRMFAKLQVGCSHESATAPFVPVPGHLYRKYRAMHKLGVSGVMQCWYFGNYPGVMTKAAGELAFAPLAASENEFLLRLAQRDWGIHARRIVKAWQWFQCGYRHFPMNHMFGWFGPMHDAPVWPLHLRPVDLRIAPSWLIASERSGKTMPASGDRIGECFGYSHTLPEILGLCRKMARNWNRGVAIMRKLLPYYAANAERRRDIGVAMALGIQFESGYNILRFYALREELPYQGKSMQLQQLAQMEKIVARELAMDAQLIDLCRADSRLGFHSEAEGYKYFPAKINWRMRQLHDLLNKDFPQVRAQIKNRAKLWPEYTGQTPISKHYHCRRVAVPSALNGLAGAGLWEGIESATLRAEQRHKNGCALVSSADAVRSGLKTSWQACHDGQKLYLRICCAVIEGQMANLGTGGLQDDHVAISIEPRRLWPRITYVLHSDGQHHFSGRKPYTYACGPDWRAKVSSDTGQHWFALVAIPLASIREKPWLRRPLRLDIMRKLIGTNGILMQNWMEQHPLEPSLGYGMANPSDLGWLILD